MDRSREYALETHYSRLRSNTLWRYNLCTVVSHIRRSSGNENYDIQVSKRYKKESWKRLVEVIGFGLFMIPFKFWWCTRMYILPRVIETFVKLSLERCWPIIECRRPSTGRNSKNENVLSSFLFFFFSSAEFTNHHNWKCFLSRTQKDISEKYGSFYIWGNRIWWVEELK